MTKNTLVICAIFLLGLSTVSSVSLRQSQYSTGNFYSNASDAEGAENQEYAQYYANQDDDNNNYQYYTPVQEAPETVATPVAVATPVVSSSKLSLSGLVSKIEAPLAKVGISLSGSVTKSSGSNGVTTSILGTPVQIVSGTKNNGNTVSTTPVSTTPVTTTPVTTQPAQNVSSPKPTQNVSAPNPVQNVSTPKPTQNVSAPNPVQNVSAPNPTKNSSNLSQAQPNTTNTSKPTNESYYTYPNGTRVPDDQVAALLAQNNTKANNTANNTNNNLSSPTPNKTVSQPAQNTTTNQSTPGESYYTYPNGTRVPEDQVAGLLAQNSTKASNGTSTGSSNSGKNTTAAAAPAATNQSTPGESYYTYPNGSRVPDDQVAGLLAQNGTKVGGK